MRFSLGLALKDAGLVAEAAAASGVDLRIGRAARQWLADAAATDANVDYAAVLAYIIAAAKP